MRRLPNRTLRSLVPAILLTLLSSLSLSACFNSSSEESSSSENVNASCAQNGKLCQFDEDCCMKHCLPKKGECAAPGVTDDAAPAANAPAAEEAAEPAAPEAASP